VTLGYNPLGQVLTTTDALTRKNVTEYDALSRPVTTTVNWQNGIVEPGDSADQDLQTIAVYDSAGRTLAQVGVGPYPMRVKLRISQTVYAATDRVDRTVSRAKGLGMSCCCSAW